MINFSTGPIAFIVLDRLDEPGGDAWREKCGFNVRMQGRLHAAKFSVKPPRTPVGPAPGAYRIRQIPGGVTPSPARNQTFLTPGVKRHASTGMIWSAEAGTDRYGDRETGPAPDPEHKAGVEAAGVVRDGARAACADREGV